MKIADLYIRVSTDEQADKGYSQRSQEELLRKYCEINKIEIRQVIFEDHSAKSFNRPQWKKYLIVLRRFKHKTDLVLFLKWDRFSRNAGDAYQMINTLRKLGVEPQAIEQPLDLSIPENKMMLAFYLAAPEVENDRRALNVIHGMRRARKEGRFMGHAPVGYVNRIDEAGKKFIAPDEPQAAIIRWTFEEISRELYNTEQIYKKAKEKGFRGTKSLFWFAIRNPVYCGKIFVPKYKDEESRLVKGQHESIVTEELFYTAQDVLDGRKRGKYKLKVASNASLPLRGFLICPDCGRVLTGSSSKGRSKYYAYYHCYMGCTFRVQAEQVNDRIVEELKKYKPIPDMVEFYKLAILEAWENKTGYMKEDRKKIFAEIKELEDKIYYVRELLASRKIDPDDFREMKSGYAARLERLESKFKGMDDDSPDMSRLLDKGLDNLLQLDYIYLEGDIEKKRNIIGSIFLEKIHFDENGFRTARLNEAAECIYRLNSHLVENKKGQNRDKSVLSCKVGVADRQPVFVSIS